MKVPLFLLLTVWGTTLFAQHLGPAFEHFVKYQRSRSLNVTLANISPVGTNPGVVVAAQSKEHPNYWYHWVRDGALAMNALIRVYQRSQDKQLVAQLEHIIWDYVAFTNKTQCIRAPRSASDYDPMGLGEPKYHVNGSPYMGHWGRPQNDGPALRASTLMRFAHEYLRRGGSMARVQLELYHAVLPEDSVIKKDLEVTARALHKPNYDLWEEVMGQHFYTTLAQRRALVTGHKFAKFMKDDGASDWYKERSKMVENALHSYWDGTLGYIATTHARVEGIDWKDSNLDIAVILGALHTYGDETDEFYAPDNDRILATFVTLKKAHHKAFAINQRFRPDLPPALGRYTEDRFYGGNPWFLATLAAGELHYRVATASIRRGVVTISPVSLPFFQDILTGMNCEPKVGLLTKGTIQFTQVIQALLRMGDMFLERVHVHIGEGGRMDEQLDRNHGHQLSARELTWSHAAFITAAIARDDAWQAYNNMDNWMVHE